MKTLPTPMDRCKICGSDGAVLVEYNYTMPEHYDGISEIMCMNPACGVRVGRWSGKELKDGEYELPLGGK